MSAYTQAFAAAPGFSIVEPISDDNKIVDAVLMPITGWLVYGEVVHPISMFDVRTHNKDAIIAPGGMVFCVDGDGVFDSIQDWMTSKNGGASEN